MQIATGSEASAPWRASVGPACGRRRAPAGEREAWAAQDMKLIRRLRLDPARESDFRQIYERFAPATFAFFLRKVGDSTLAADLNQELFLKLSRSIGNFQERCSWRTWVFLIARSVAAEAREKRFRDLAHRTVTLEETSLKADLRLPENADDRARRILLEVRLRVCLRRLNEVARAVILGHYFQGVTLQELTSRLRLGNPSGSRAVLIGAQRKLRRCLEERGRP